MKFDVDKNELSKIERLLMVKRENIAVADLFNELISNEVVFNSGSDLNSIKEQIFEIMEIDQGEKETMLLLNKILDKSITIKDLSIFESNPYKNIVKSPQFSYKSAKYDYLSYQTNTLIPFDDIKVDAKDDYREYSSIAFINKQYSYPAVIKNNSIWMSIIPNEIKTMDPYINKCKGRVITFGLGLGYFAFMASLKPEVEQVTVIEKDHDIINLFNQNIFNYFPYKEKIKIIAENAFLYLSRNPKLVGYDYAFFDMWHTPEDGLNMYVSLKKRRFSCPSGYWLETSLLALYRRCFLQVVEEQIAGEKESLYLKAKNDTDKVINSIYFKTKTITISSYAQLKALCTDENLIKLIQK